MALSHRDFLEIDKNYEAAAGIADLVYVSDKDPGITRAGGGKHFAYIFEGQRIREEKQLERIKRLAVPPAWTHVWICRNANGHIQATGLDAMGRKQYRYHRRWHALQNETKFHRMSGFGKALPALRRRLRDDLAAAGFPGNRVMAMLVSLMEKTYIRIGNNGYEKLYGSYGLSTMKNRHVSIEGNIITFSFKGKKGIYHRIELMDKRFARIIKQCKAIPGSELFQYYDDAGKVRKVDSGQVNQYIKECSGSDFTTKDFRTWAGSLMMLRCLRAGGPGAKPTEFHKKLAGAYRQVSGKLGNTVAVCKKYYVHPGIAELYLSGQLDRFFAGSRPERERWAGLSADEKVLVMILRFIEREEVPRKLTVRLKKVSIKKASETSRRRGRAA